MTTTPAPIYDDHFDTGNPLFGYTIKQGKDWNDDLLSGDMSRPGALSIYNDENYYPAKEAGIIDVANPTLALTTPTGNIARMALFGLIAYLLV